MGSNFKAARALGWTSLAVGATELLATRWLEKEMGVDDQHTLIRAFGARELAAGGMILAEPGITSTLAGGLWARVVGDALDLVSLGLAAKSTKRPSGLASITAIVLGVTALDVIVAARIQMDLRRGAAVSQAARHRVRRQTPAVPSLPTAVPPSVGASL